MDYTIMMISAGDRADPAKDLVRLWRPALLKAAAKAILSALTRSLDWQSRWRQRCQLLELSDRALHDIGLNRLEAEREAFKPFWLP